MRIVHTSAQGYGQIYAPVVNWLLMFALKQIDLRPPVHLPLDQFEFRDLAFCLPVRPRQRDGGANGQFFFGGSTCE